MNRNELFEKIRTKQSFLCVGLDPDPAKLPAEFEGDVLAFNKSIIDATSEFCVAYKPNTAFYEALGLHGLHLLKQTIDYIGDDHLVIADAKRGDIGNTSRYYAEFAFNTLGADAITVAPYMGADSVQPFLEFTGKWTVLLALTSNPGSQDFQTIPSATDAIPLYQRVIRKGMEWGDPDRLMFVCGATRAEKFSELRTLCPEHFFLVPGIGAQGGDLEAVCRYGMNDRCGLLVSSSRGIIYAEHPRVAARELQQKMAAALNKFLSKVPE